MGFTFPSHTQPAWGHNSTISTRSTSTSRLPDLIHSRPGLAHAHAHTYDNSDHRRNESWASTISGSSISTSAALSRNGSRKIGAGVGVEFGEVIRECEEEDGGGVESLRSGAGGTGYGSSGMGRGMFMDSFSLESYEKEGVPGMSGPKRFKCNPAGGARHGHGECGSASSTIAASNAGSAPKARKGRRPSVIVREESMGSFAAGGADMRDVLDEILKMEKSFQVESDREMSMSEEERDPLYGRTSVPRRRKSVAVRRERVDSPLEGGRGVVPATPMTHMRRASLVPPPAPMRASKSYPAPYPDIPLLEESERRPSIGYIFPIPAHHSGHTPSRSEPLGPLLPPKDYPEGNWELSPGSGHPTKITHKPTTSTSISIAHTHLRNLSSSSELIRAVSRESSGSGRYSAPEMSPEPVPPARHRVRRSLTFESTPTGPRFPSDSLIVSGLAADGTPTFEGAGMTLDTPPTALVNLSRRSRRRVVDDSVTRFQFPLRIETSAERLKAVEIPKDLITPTHIHIKVDAAPGKITGRNIEGADAITPTQGYFGQDGYFPPALNPYIQPASRFAQPAPVGLLQPSALPATPVQTRAPLSGVRLVLGENDMEVD